jgi:hypothetical protein
LAAARAAIAAMYDGVMRDSIAFADWCAQLEAVGRSKGNPYGRKGIIINTGAECWFEYWQDGHTPDDAVDEDLSHAD